MAIATVGLATVAGAAIFDRDDRVVSGAATTPVGIVSGSGNSYGSGFLIDDCHVLTARHVIGVRENVGRKARFRLPMRTEDRSDGTIVATGRTALRRGDHSDDWALIRLDRCLGRIVGYYPISDSGFTRSGTSSRLFPALVGLGYPRDRGGRRLIVDPDCAAHQRTDIGLRHDCAALPGGSGGPLLAWNIARSRYEAVGINAAEYRQPSEAAFALERANLAVELAPLRSRIEAATRANPARSR